MSHPPAGGGVRAHLAGDAPARPFRHARVAVVPATLLLALLITLLAWLSAEHAVETAAEARFEARVSEIASRVRVRMEEYAQVLRGGAALFAASESVERHEWRMYIEALRLQSVYPGILGVGFVRRVPLEHADAHVAEVRAEGLATYTIQPQGERAEYFPVVFIEPMSEANMRVLGYDLYSERVRRAAMDRARDTGSAAVSRRVTLIQEGPTNIQPGVLMYLPVYRNGADTQTEDQRRRALAGYVYAPFRMEDLMQGILGAVPDIRVELFDGQEIIAHSLLYDSAPRDASMTSLLSVSQIALPDHAWTMRATPLRSLLAGMDRTRPRAILASGVVISLLLTALAWALATHRDRALRLASSMTTVLEESREQLTMALEGSDLALFDWHLDDGTVVLSRGWNAILGGSPQPTLTSIAELESLVHAEDLPALKRHLAAVLRGEARFYEVEHRVRTYDGGWKWIASRAKVTKRDASGRATRITGTNADITDKKQIEALKDEFVSTVSHELRTPLTSIIGGLALMKEDAEGLPEDARMLLDLAYENAERLTALVNDILDLEKLQSGRMRFEPGPIELDAFLRQALRLNAPYARTHRTHFVLEEPVPSAALVADESRLQQVMTNLLSNAAKFSPENSPVEVRARAQNGRVRIEVADHGPGIAPDFRDRIFSRFAQSAVGGTAPHGGTGLGLAISKAIVEASGGEIGFESTPGEGATFYFELPQAR